MTKLFFTAIICLFMSAGLYAQSIIGTWELVYIAPLDMMDTEPRGITNLKLFFREDGKLFTMLPDQPFSDDLSYEEYKLSKDSLSIINQDEAQNVFIFFPSSDTLTVYDEYGGTRSFKRINGDNAEYNILEPKSIQLVNTGDSKVKETTYDTMDYSSLPIRQRLAGVWEAVAFENVPRQEMPPYGFFNDIWKIFDSTITMTSRADEQDVTVKYFIADSSITLLAEDGSSILWNFSFNQWGNLVVGDRNGLVRLKLVTKDIHSNIKIPLKVVLLKIKDED